MIHKQVCRNTINNSKVIRLIWHRKGDLRLYDNELYHHNHHNITRTNQQKESTKHTSEQQTFLLNTNSNYVEQLKIVSLYVINPDDYTPRLVTGSVVSTNSSVPHTYNNKNKNNQQEQFQQGQEKQQQQQQQQKYESKNDNNDHGIDDNLTNNNPLWTVNEGPYASVALIDALSDLRINLQQLGGELLIRYGNPLIVIPIIISNIIQTILYGSNDNDENNDNNTGQLQQKQQQKYYTIQIVWNEIPGSYEQKLSKKMKEVLQNQFQKISSFTSSSFLSPTIQIQIQTTAIYTLYHPNDLPTTKESWIQLSRPKEQFKKTKNRIKSKQSQNDNINNSDISNEQQQQPLQYNNSPVNYFVHCDQSRWDAIPRIMGDFRRAARTYTNVRQCYPKPYIETIQSFPITSASLLNNTVDINVQDQHSHTHHPMIIIESGNIPTLEQLTAPYKGKSLFGLPCEIFDKIICNLVSQQLSSSSTSSSSSSSKSSCTYYYGETSSLKRWDEFLTLYAATANRSLADTSYHQSAHISTALALGVLSPRHMYWSVVEKIIENENQQHPPSTCNDDEDNNKQEDNANTSNKISNNSSSLQWLQSHMEMRDHFIFSAFAAGDKLYNLHGTTIPIHNSKKKTKQGNNVQDIVWKSINDNDTYTTFQKWALGQTGLPLIDSGMYELYYTGYISNRVRQNIASVLTKDLYIDWRLGAEYYQFWLMDHCVSANWGNWQYFSGVGNDPKNRHFRTISQSIQYDPYCAYIEKWYFNSTIQPIVDVIQQEEKEEQYGSNKNMQKSIDWEQYPKEVLFRPWDFIRGWETIVDPNTQYTYNDKQRLDSTGNLLLVTDETITTTK